MLPSLRQAERLLLVRDTEAGKWHRWGQFDRTNRTGAWACAMRVHACACVCVPLHASACACMVVLLIARAIAAKQPQCMYHACTCMHLAHAHAHAGAVAAKLPPLPLSSACAHRVALSLPGFGYSSRLRHGQHGHKAPLTVLAVGPRAGRWQVVGSPTVLAAAELATYRIEAPYRVRHNLWAPMQSGPGRPWALRCYRRASFEAPSNALAPPRLAMQVHCSRAVRRSCMCAGRMRNSSCPVGATPRPLAPSSRPVL